jgi:hypothetical protein
MIIEKAHMAKKTKTKKKERHQTVYGITTTTTIK